MKKIELLSPAGDFETLKMAINAQADAVYLSGKNYGARKFAKNFTKLYPIPDVAPTINIFINISINFFFYFRCI